jgi:hypothetical protein
LPVGVGDEADRGVEGQVGRRALETLRVERQQVLEAQDQVEDDEARRRERQHGEGVGQPVLVPLRVDPEGLVEHAFDRPQDRVEPRPLAGPDPGHVDAERPG